MQIIKPTEQQPITDRTKAINAMSQQLQDVTEDVREIKQMLKAGESWKSAFWRAVTQFIGDMKNGR